MDLSLENASVMQVVGPSGSGKTHFVCQLLQHDTIYANPHKKIYWLMGIDETETGKTEHEFQKLKNIIVKKGFEPGWIDLLSKGDVIVIDDLFHEANKEENFNNLFTKVARHRQVTVIFITQNLFHQGGNHRTRNLNVHYLVLFKNPRDRTVISFIARQSFPENYKFLVDAYHDATDCKPHGYLFIDFTQSCDENLRVRSNLFDPSAITIYKQI